jgi:hypothetical protein
MLDELWNNYHLKKRELKQARKAYEKFRDSYKAHRTPPSSDNE